jgi:hypothetical protein
MTYRYFFSIVRCVPNPRTGEFINVGAIAGSSDAGDWAVREVSNEKRVRSLADGHDISTYHEFLVEAGLRIDRNAELVDEGREDPLDEAWLQQLHHDYRNVVQLSPPSLVLAGSAESALDVIFENYVVDPTRPSRNVVTKHRAVSALSAAYKRAEIDPAHVKRGVDVLVGDHLSARLDFAIGNGSTVQLTQGWSFRVAGVEEISTQVKSWAYALSRLRDGIETRIISAGSDLQGNQSTVPADVDLEVVIVTPETERQRQVFDEASQVFTELDVAVRTVTDVDLVSRRAAELISHRPSH